MTDELDTHEKLFAAFQEYCKFHDKFEWNDVDYAGHKARIFLAKIRALARERRKEIMDKRHRLKESRNGRNGRPPKVTK